jgi:cyanophycinase
MGPVALLGSGEFEPWTDDVDRAVLEAATGDGSVAILPTASEPEGEMYAEWARRGLEHYADLGVPARVIELKGREDAEAGDLARQIEGASLIFFSGGNPAFLARVLEGSAIWSTIVTAVERGAAFAGCSAGACVAGEFAPDSMTEHVWEDRWVSGLRLLPGVWVVPHFDALDSYRAGLRDFFLSRVPEDDWAIGVDERTAVVRFGDAWRVFGEGGVLVRNRGVAFRAGPGSVIELAHARGTVDAVDADVVTILDALPAGAGPIGLLSAEQFSEGSRHLDEVIMERTGPRVGIVLAADPSNAETVGRAALEHYGALGGRPRVLGPDEDLSDVDVLFLAGGDPGNLVPAVQGSPLWERALDRWRAGMGLAGSSAGAMALHEHCLFAEPGSSLPTTWGRGLGPMRSCAAAVHATSRPEDWIGDIHERAPVPLLILDDAAGMLMAPAEPPLAFGGGRVYRTE